MSIVRVNENQFALTRRLGLADSGAALGISLERMVLEQSEPETIWTTVRILAGTNTAMREGTLVQAVPNGQVRRAGNGKAADGLVVTSGQSSVWWSPEVVGWFSLPSELADGPKTLWLGERGTLEAKRPTTGIRQVVGRALEYSSAQGGWLCLIRPQPVENGNRPWVHDEENFIYHYPGWLDFYVAGERVARLGSSDGRLYLKSHVKELAYTSDATQTPGDSLSGLVEFNETNGSIGFGVFNIADSAIVMVAELLPGGIFRVQKIQENTEWPLGGVSAYLNDPIAWTTGASALDFSVDKHRSHMRLESTGASPYNATLKVKVFRENVEL